MELSSSCIKKVSYIFLYFRNGNPPKNPGNRNPEKLLIFQKTELSNPKPEKNSLYFRKCNPVLFSPSYYLLVLKIYQK